MNGVRFTRVRLAANPSLGLIALTHRLREYDRVLKAGAWEHLDERRTLNYPIRERAGRTLGIVGYGALGRGVARNAEAFDMRVWVANRPGDAPVEGRLDLVELPPLVDVLSLHCPLTPAPRNLIGAPELSRTKRDAVLINTARGGLVDAGALAAALRAGRLGGAAIDVLTEEPPVAGNPLLAPDLGQVIVAPHTAWAARSPSAGHRRTCRQRRRLSGRRASQRGCLRPRASFSIGLSTSN